MKSVLVLAFSLASCGFVAAQSTPSSPAKTFPGKEVQRLKGHPELPAPSSSAEVFAGKDVTSQLSTLADKAAKSGSSGTTLVKADSHNIQLSIRTKSGGAEVHKHFTDIFYVISGSATLITGGEVDNPKEASEGETRGTEIKNGKSQTLSPGTIVHIPAGTPHQLIIPEGTTYECMVVKVKES